MMNSSTGGQSGGVGGNGQGSSQAVQTGADTSFAKGFMYDPVKNKYYVNDPTGVKNRPFDASGNNQPYATNLSNSLEQSATQRKPEDG